MLFGWQLNSGKNFYEWKGLPNLLYLIKNMIGKNDQVIAKYRRFFPFFLSIEQFLPSCNAPETCLILLPSTGRQFSSSIKPSQNERPFIVLNICYEVIDKLVEFVEVTCWPLIRNIAHYYYSSAPAWRGTLLKLYYNFIKLLLLNIRFGKYLSTHVTMPASESWLAWFFCKVITIFACPRA